MGTQLRNPPLVYFLAQVVTNARPNMETYIPEFQKHLRSDFPDYREEQFVTVQTPASGAQLTPPVLITTKRWHFLNMEKTCGFTFLSDVLVFHGASYPGFSRFLEQILRGVDCLNKTATIDYTERIALRYVNAASMSKADEHVINIALRGMAGNAEYAYAATDTSLTLDRETTLLIKSMRRHKNMFFPQELQPIPMEIREIEGEDVITLDLDCFTLARRAFDLTTIKENFITLHEHIEKAFYSALDKKFFNKRA